MESETKTIQSHFNRLHPKSIALQPNAGRGAEGSVPNSPSFNDLRIISSSRYEPDQGSEAPRNEGSFQNGYIDFVKNNSILSHLAGYSLSRYSNSLEESRKGPNEPDTASNPSFGPISTKESVPLLLTPKRGDQLQG